MASSLRFAYPLRTATVHHSSRRFLTSSAIVRQGNIVQTQKKPVGGIRGGYVKLSAQCA